MTPADELFAAIAANDRIAIERLLRQHPGLQRTARRDGRTPLHAAIESAQATSVLALLQNGPDLAAIVEQRAGGVTDAATGLGPLHLAVVRGNRQILDLVLTAPGLVLGTRTPDGETALAMAERLGRAPLAEMIRDRAEQAGQRQPSGRR